MKLHLTTQNTALIIIDIQYDFCAETGLATQKGMDILPIQTILPELKKFQKEIQKYGILTVFTQWLSSEKHTPSSFQTLFDEGILTPLYLSVEDTPGADLFYLNPPKKRLGSKEIFL